MELKNTEMHRNKWEYLQEIAKKFFTTREIYDDLMEI